MLFYFTAVFRIRFASIDARIRLKHTFPGVFFATYNERKNYGIEESSPLTEVKKRVKYKDLVHKVKRPVSLFHSCRVLNEKLNAFTF